MATDGPSPLQRLRLATRRLVAFYRPPADAANRDALQLRALAATFYATGVLCALCSCFSVPNVMVLLFMTAPPLAHGNEVEITPAFLFWLTVFIMGFFLTLLLIERLCFLTSQSITQRRRLPFVRAMAWAALLMPPLGPFLCLYALRLLGRPHIRSLFQS